jgi:hypothetical protein
MHNELQTYLNRFAVLATERFRIFKPDALELRWNIFDTQEKRTVGFGGTPEQAADHAFEYCRRNNVHLDTKNYVF